MLDVDRSAFSRTRRRRWERRTEGTTVLVSLLISHLVLSNLPFFSFSHLLKIVSSTPRKQELMESGKGCKSQSTVPRDSATPWAWNYCFCSLNYLITSYKPLSILIRQCAFVLQSFMILFGNLKTSFSNDNQVLLFFQMLRFL